MYHQIRWTSKKIAQRIGLMEPLVHRRQAPLPPFRYAKLGGAGAAPIIGPEVDRSHWQVIEPNSHWGAGSVDFMLSTRVRVPADWPADAPVALFLPLGEAGGFSHPEALVYLDGQAYGACDRHHQELHLGDVWRDGKSHQLDLHGFSGALHRDPSFLLYMGSCAVAQIDAPTRDFLITARTALGVAVALEANHPARGQLLNALDAAFRLVDLREPFGDRFYDSIPGAADRLKSAIAAAGPPLPVHILAAGHAHIDVAWLWTLDQTRRKVGRSFHTVLRLMEQFPDYHFTQSQPQLYDYLRQDYPGLFEAIRERVAEGRWEVIGGMWVEADCNLSGGESLARQFLLGRSFFRKHFGEGAESPILWLPDVFGYAWNLPQLIKEAGLEYFFTIKIGWSQYNRLPYDSFWWQGLDGTRVLTHFSTTPDPTSDYASTYNANATPEAALGTWNNFQQKSQQNELLMVYGWGDGGGGPTREMLENIQAMAAFPATPQMRSGKAIEFFRNMEADCGERLPVWNGELYLELHRGTYTSQSRGKRANRKSEFLLHDAEFLATLATLVDPGYAYPAKTLRKAWELVCLNQFHDILPGSSIGPVHAESLQQYRQVETMGQRVRDQALAVIARGFQGDLLLVVNPTGFSRSDLALWAGQLRAGETLQHRDGRPAHIQANEAGTLVDAGELPPYSVTPLVRSPGATRPHTAVKATDRLLENDHLRVALNDHGELIRIHDKLHDREVLADGGIANQFQAFEDRPLQWDAWDIDVFYDEKRYLADPATAVRVVESGPLRATLMVTRRILHSEYTQHISLGHNSTRLDFATRIHWRERHILLKVAFPVAILAPTATYEIQWGNVERPTHRNTSWDWARFETCAQKWVDLSEGGYGVSLLNDCKYGHDIQGNVMRLTLLRGPTTPDPDADQGEHCFSYSLFPHGGRWDQATIREAYALNDPLLLVAKGGESETSGGGQSATAGVGRLARSLVSVDQPNVVIETVKRAEDGAGIIVRLYEAQRRRGSVRLTTGFDLSGAQQVNLLEENPVALAVEANTVTFGIRPYQIVTLRLVPHGA